MTIEKLIKDREKKTRTTLTISIDSKVKKEFMDLVEELFPGEKVSRLVEEFMINGIKEMKSIKDRLVKELSRSNKELKRTEELKKKG